MLHWHAGARNSFVVLCDATLRDQNPEAWSVKKHILRAGEWPLLCGIEETGDEGDGAGPFGPCLHRVDFLAVSLARAPSHGSACQ